MRKIQFDSEILAGLCNCLLGLAKALVDIQGQINDLKEKLDKEV